MASNNNIPTLPPDVAKEYELVDWPGPHTKLTFGRFGKVDLETITLRRARSLSKRGFSKIRPKESTKEVTKEKGSGK